MKRLSCGNFTSSSNVILQCTCFDLSDTRIDSTITYYLFTSGYFIFARKITWSTVRGSIKLLDWQCHKKTPHDQERNQLIFKLHMTETCFLKMGSYMNYPHFLKGNLNFHKLHWWCINTMQIISKHMSQLISLESR